MQAKVIGKYADERNVVHCDHGPSSIVRNRYFYSMLLEAQDLAQDQAFHLGNIRRHDAELHGFGTVCGLRVERTPCHEQVRIKAGVAIDRRGGEIRVESDALLDLHEAIEEVVKKRAAPAQREVQPRAPGIKDDGCADPVDVFVTLVTGRATSGRCRRLGARSPARSHVPDVAHPLRVVLRGEGRAAADAQAHRVARRRALRVRARAHRGVLCEWVIDRCWQCEPDPCGKEHHCLGLARVRVVPGGSVGNRQLLHQASRVADRAPGGAVAIRHRAHGEGVMNAVTMSKSRCGCASKDPAARRAMSKQGCGCSGGCGGSCGCGGNGGSGQATSAPCTSGTPEATARPGVVVSKLPPAAAAVLPRRAGHGRGPHGLGRLPPRTAAARERRALGVGRVLRLLADD